MPEKVEPCPYCGGDESKCDFDYKTDKCNQLELMMSDNPYEIAARDTHAVDGRKLVTEEVAAIQKCRRHAVNVGILCDEIAQMGGIDQRWVAIAKTDLQKGFMALIRAVAKPETF